jgi:hypothetical protein
MTKVKIRLAEYPSNKIISVGLRYHVTARQVAALPVTNTN